MSSAANLSAVDIIYSTPPAVPLATARRARPFVAVPSTLQADPISISIIIPVYNENGLIELVVTSLLRETSRLPFDAELILCENGSTDGTRETLAALAARHPQVRLETLERPSYGSALKRGIQAAKNDLVILFNADLWCVQFLNDAIALHQSGYDMVIGSKRLDPKLDSRPPLRRLITHVFNRFLALTLGFQGTDTHGMKTFRKSVAQASLELCVTDREIFDTELVLRLQRSGARICELPVSVADRRPARLSLLRRVPSTVVDLWRIWKSL